MPLYEYRCESCGQLTERIQKFSDPPLEICPSCGGTLTKLLSSPAIQFKGSGWYITDYARKSGEGKDKTASSDKTEKSDKSEKTATSDSASSTTDTNRPTKTKD